MTLQSLIEILKKKDIPHDKEGKFLKFSISQGRDQIPVYFTQEIVAYIVEKEIQVYDFKFIEGFSAIWSPSLDIIECEIEIPHGMPLSYIFKEILNNENFQIPTNIENLKIELSEVSYEHFFLTTCKNNQRRSNFLPKEIERINRLKSSSISLKLKGLMISTHDKALEAINNIVGSICFQLDCQTNLSLIPAIELQRTRTEFKRLPTDFVINKIQQKYDTEALSLYWYAQSAFGKPLLQYLAYYQVVEFYYPRYAAQIAQRKIKNLLKQPNFNHNSDTDISKLFNIINSTTMSRSELSQLEATVIECISPIEFREFLERNNELKVYLNSKDAIKLSPTKVHSSDDHEILRQLWQRFYNIRCRIVHTKDDEAHMSILHPQSKEIKFLHYDLKLAKYLAQQVLIAASKELTV